MAFTSGSSPNLVLKLVARSPADVQAIAVKGINAAWQMVNHMYCVLYVYSAITIYFRYRNVVLGGRIVTDNLSSFVNFNGRISPLCSCGSST